MELPIAAFVAGLAGGIHCVGMCGGIAAALGGASRRTVPIAVAAGASPPFDASRLLAFNAGRIASYALAGAGAGAIGGIAAAAGPLDIGRNVAFIVTQAMLVLLGLYIAGWTAVLPRFETAGAALWQRIEPLRRRCLPIDSLPRALVAGALWGWVPCGLVYGMLPFALAGAGAAKGALTLVAFGLGTLPWLLVAGSAGSRLAWLRHRAGVRRAAGGLLIALAMLSVLQLLHG